MCLNDLLLLLLLLPWIDWSAGVMVMVMVMVALFSRVLFLLMLCSWRLCAVLCAVLDVSAIPVDE